jgi:repressor LexA
VSLTKGQRKFLEFLEKFQLEHGYRPTYDEIARGLGFKSKSAAFGYMKRLEDAGHTFSLASKTETTASLPVLGRVAAGRPIEFVETDRSVQVPLAALAKSGEHFALQVQGDSMIEDHICDGDLIVVRKQESAENGEIVVAMLDNEATLKRLYRKKGTVELHPANAKYRPIVVGAHQIFRIAGVLVYLQRKF